MFLVIRINNRFLLILLQYHAGNDFHIIFNLAPARLVLFEKYFPQFPHATGLTCWSYCFDFRRIKYLGWL